jgi:hypothetical protein
MEFKKISLDGLTQRSQKESVNLLIQSQDPEIYLAEAEVGGVRYGVTAGRGQRLMTRSLGALKRELTEVRYIAATLRHRSSFDEMIGNPAASSDLAFEMPINL